MRIIKERPRCIWSKSLKVSRRYTIRCIPYTKGVIFNVADRFHDIDEIRYLKEDRKVIVMMLVRSVFKCAILVFACVISMLYLESHCKTWWPPFGGSCVDSSGKDCIYWGKLLLTLQSWCIQWRNVCMCEWGLLGMRGAISLLCVRVQGGYISCFCFSSQACPIRRYFPNGNRLTCNNQMGNA